MHKLRKMVAPKTHLRVHFFVLIQNLWLDQFPYCYYIFRVFNSDDIVIDSHGNFLLEYVKNSEHQSKLISYMMKRMYVSNEESREL